MIRKSIWACALGLMVLAWLSVMASAQVTATVVTKSGQRYTGHDVRYRVDHREVSLRTSQNETPRLPVDQVAYVDLGGSPDVDPGLSGSQEAVALRGGTVLKGKVLELGPTNPSDESSQYLVIFRTENGEEKRLNGNDVARVYFAGYTAPGSSGSSNTGGGTIVGGSTQGITVNSKQQWTPTGVVVRRGDMVSFEASGEIKIGGPGNPPITPAGVQQDAPGAPLTTAPAGALIGRIGNSPPFFIGERNTIRMPAAGQLFVGVNDGNVGDNEGSFQVKVNRR
jgi:hypothetical protein